MTVADDGADELIAELLADGGGGFMLGTLHVALPLNALREVVELTPLRCVPGQAAGLIGAIDLRGALLPVLDLRQLLCRLPNEASHPCVVVMVHQGRLLGLLADQVTGTFRCSASGVHRVRGDGLTALFAASVRREGDQGLTNLLSPQALCALPGLPMIDDPEPERSAVVSSSDEAALTTSTRPLMLLRLGRQMMAIDAVAVGTTCSAPLVQASALAMGHCRGVVENLGLHLPVVDLSDYCGMGRNLTAASAAQGDMLVVQAGAGQVGLLVDAVTDVVAVPATAVVRLPALAQPRAGLFAGSVSVSDLPESCRARLPADCGHLLVLDSEALARQEDLQALATAASASSRESPQDGAAHPGRPGAADPLAERQEMLVFSLASEWCTPVHHVCEILSIAGSAMTPPARPDDALMLGLLSDRGRAIPVLDLARLTGDQPPADQPPQAALLVQLGEEWLGFAVHRLQSIDKAGWQPHLPAIQSTQHSEALAQVLGRRDLAELGAGAESRLVRVLDLQAVASALAGGSSCH